jgi:hypothetical protein
METAVVKQCSAVMDSGGVVGGHERSTDSGAARGRCTARRTQRPTPHLTSLAGGHGRSRWIRRVTGTNTLLHLTHALAVRRPGAVCCVHEPLYTCLPAYRPRLLAKHRVLYQPTRRLLSSSARHRSLPST